MFKEIQHSRNFMGTCAHGTDLLDELTTFCEKENIALGRIEAIGAVQKARIGFYNQQGLKYQFTEINQCMEILKCTGNISLNNGKSMVHAHITLADEHSNAVGGHLAQGTIVFACEFIIQAFDNAAVIRDYDKVTGLRLWKE